MSAKAAPRTKAEREGELALAALRRGQEALAAGDAAAALDWLERAARYAPDDPAPQFSLAGALLAHGDTLRAAETFAAVAAEADVREAWLGAAVAWMRLRRVAEAVRALGNALSRHRWDGQPGVADAVAEAAGLPGWCALDGLDRVVVQLPRREKARLALEGGKALAPDVPVPAGARLVHATSPDGRALLGSPVDVAAIRRVEGVVEVADGGLAGWAWHPGDADRDPVLECSDGVTRRSVVACDHSLITRRALARPRGFAVSAADCLAFAGPVAVRGPDGRPLAGSPADPAAMLRQAASVARTVARAWPFAAPRADRRPPATLLPVPAAVVGRPAGAPLAPRRPVAVVVPAYRGLRETMECLEAVQRTVPDGTAIVVVEDASPEPELAAALDRLAAAGTIRLTRLPRNRGFPAAANAGLRLARTLPGEPDVVLLNSDTLPTAGWLQRLRDAVHAAPDIGTATPFSNDATLLTYPDPRAPKPPPGGAALATLGRLAARANDGVAVEVPTAVGFCMYLRRECLQAAGVFREDAFAQGYGEENDFCLRARHLGWRHVAVPGAYVAHVGGRSFGAAREALLGRNLDVLERLHPGYRALINACLADDPLLPARRRLDTLRARSALRRRGAGAVLLVTHDSGGGVERCVRARVQAVRALGQLPIVLRPVLDRTGHPDGVHRAYLPGLCEIDIDAARWPNLRYRLPDELDELAALLRVARPVAMEVHHLLGHHHAVLELAGLFGIAYDMRVHDYAAFCPRISLMGPAARYCGEPDVAGCEACVADAGPRIEEDISVPELLRRSAAELAGAATVIVPSGDAARRLRRHFPSVRPLVEPHEDDAALPPLDAAGAVPGRACVVGAIGPEKGFDVLLGCARDARARGLKLEFRVVGHTVDDARLLATGRVFITGPYKPPQAEALIRAQRAAFAFIPSVWPETWCLALGEALRAGLGVVAFDIGAPAERIRATGRGWLLPLGLSPTAINNTLLTLAPLAGVGNVMHTS